MLWHRHLCFGEERGASTVICPQIQYHSLILYMEKTKYQFYNEGFCYLQSNWTKGRSVTFQCHSLLHLAKEHLSSDSVCSHTTTAHHHGLQGADLYFEQSLLCLGKGERCSLSLQRCGCSSVLHRNNTELRPVFHPRHHSVVKPCLSQVQDKRVAQLKFVLNQPQWFSTATLAIFHIIHSATTVRTPQ